MLTRSRTVAISSLKAAWPKGFLRALVGSGADIQTYTSFHERVLLYDEATLAYQNGVFAEIGSYVGASAVILAAALKRRSSALGREGKVLCVDTWTNDAMSEGKRDTWDEFQQNTIRWQPYIAALRGTSDAINLPEVDLLFIDGDHTYPAVRADVDRHLGCVRVGGRVVFHDQDRIGVAKVVGEVLTTGKWRVSEAVERIISLVRVAV